MFDLLPSLSYDEAYEKLKKRDIMSFFTTNAERRRFLSFEERKANIPIDSGRGETLWDRYSIYVMNTDEAPITFDEWLNT